jgi:FixJ family two-component response regulator
MSGHSYIAIVDDDPSVCAALSRLLRLAHFQPIDYASAEAYLEDHKRPQFDCLVLDIRLGDMSGLDLLARLAADKDHPPVIVVTAVEEPVARARSEALGCAGFFCKSTSGASLVEAIRRATLAELPAP